jgi:cytochrome c peroxidase
VPPNYTSGKLTLAEGFTPPANHPNREDIVARTVGTDADAALKTRKGTGLYKIPSLRGAWYRRSLLHDGSVTTLEELFDAARLDPDYRPTGWNPPGIEKRAVKGHAFGLSLPPTDKEALLAFLRSL